MRGVRHPFAIRRKAPVLERCGRFQKLAGLEGRETEKPQILASLIEHILTIARPVVWKSVGTVLGNELFLLRAGGVFQIQIKPQSTIRAKYDLPTIWTPDRHGVNGGVEGEPLGTLVLKIVSPDIRVLARR